MKWRFFSFVLIMSTLVSACNIPFTLSAGLGGKNKPLDVNYVVDSPADPIHLTITPEDNQVAEAVIPIEGGTLSVTGKDGTRYTLTVPADALINETRISMQPVAQITGMPFGGEQTYAVQLGPQGMAFNQYVTLTITPAQELPVDQQIMFGFQNKENELILATPQVDSREINIKLMHFSGYGVTKGLLADIEPVRERLGGDAESRLASAFAAQLTAERQRILLGGEPADLSDLFSEYFRLYEEQVLTPRVAAAGESCAAGRLALQTALAFEREKQLLGGGSESFGDYLSNLLKTVSNVCVKEEYEMCAQDHIIHRMIPVWLGLSRQYQLLGVAQEGSPEPEELKLAKELTKKCLTFEMVFESTGTFDDGSSGGYESSVKSNVKLHFDPETKKISGQAPLVNTAFDYRVEGCSTNSSRGGGTFDAINLVYISDTKSPTDELGYVRDFLFSYYPGLTSEVYSVTCPDSPTFTSPPSILWTGTFFVTHEDELDLSGSSEASSIPDFSNMFGAETGGGAGMGPLAIPAAAGFISQDWEVFGDEYFAKKEWIKEAAEVGVVETGTLKLYHHPGQ